MHVFYAVSTPITLSLCFFSSSVEWSAFHSFNRNTIQINWRFRFQNLCTQAYSKQGKHEHSIWESFFLFFSLFVSKRNVSLVAFHRPICTTIQQANIMTTFFYSLWWKVKFIFNVIPNTINFRLRFWTKDAIWVREIEKICKYLLEIQTHSSLNQ